MYISKGCRAWHQILIAQGDSLLYPQQQINAFVDRSTICKPPISHGCFTFLYQQEPIQSNIHLWDQLQEAWTHPIRHPGYALASQSLGPSAVSNSKRSLLNSTLKDSKFSLGLSFLFIVLEHIDSVDTIHCLSSSSYFKLTSEAADPLDHCTF